MPFSPPLRATPVAEQPIRQSRPITRTKRVRTIQRQGAGAGHGFPRTAGHLTRLSSLCPHLARTAGTSAHPPDAPSHRPSLTREPRDGRGRAPISLARAARRAFVRRPASDHASSGDAPLPPTPGTASPEAPFPPASGTASPDVAPRSSKTRRVHVASTSRHAGPRSSCNAL